MLVVFFSTMCATLHGICKRKLTGDGSVANCNDTSDENDVEMAAEDDASQDQTNEVYFSMTLLIILGNH